MIILYLIDEGQYGLHFEGRFYRFNSTLEELEETILVQKQLPNTLSREEAEEIIKYRCIYINNHEGKTIATNDELLSYIVEAQGTHMFVLHFLVAFYKYAQGTNTPFFGKREEINETTNTNEA